MKRKFIRIIVLLIAVVFAWLYVCPYIQWMASPFSWNEADLNKDGFVSPTEADYFGNYGKRPFAESGKSCTEYFALKDGRTLKKDCEKETTVDHQAIATYLSAFATLLVAILAIWGDWFRAKLAPPKLRIEPHNLRGHVTQFTDGSRAIFYHLKVVNLRRWFVVKNCRVQLVAMYQRGPDGQFRRGMLPFPIQLTWAPAETSPLFETITHDRIFDIGFLIENDVTGFQPRIITTPHNFQGYVGAGGACRYSLQVVADNYVSPIQAFEVSWNGTWSDNLDNMTNSLVISEVAKGQE